MFPKLAEDIDDAARIAERAAIIFYIYMGLMAALVIAVASEVVSYFRSRGEPKKKRVSRMISIFVCIIAVAMLLSPLALALFL